MRLIDADAFVTYLKSEKERQHLDKMKTEHLSVGDVIDAVIDDLNGTALCGYKNAPTVDAEPIRHGHWSKEMVSYKDQYGDFHFGYECSRCKSIVNKGNYCPKCGAKMDEVVNE